MASTASDPDVFHEDEPKVEQPVAEEQQQARSIRGFQWVLVVCSILTTTFLFGLDNTIVAVIQPAVVNDFDSVNRLPWLSVAFLVGAASTTLFWGQMYGQGNSKWLYITCIILFEVGSAICGAAPNMDALIVGRAICGFGGTGMYTGVLLLLSLLTTPRERSTYFGLCGLVWGTGTVLGPIIGGAFTSSSAGWRWAFYINLCVAGACAPVYLFMIPSLEMRPGATILDRAKKIDFIGTILLSGAFVSILMAISFGGVVYAWSSGQIIALFVVAGVLTIAFVVQQLAPQRLVTTKEDRAFPFRFFKNISLMIVFILECCSATLTFIPIYFVPLYFQFVRSDSAIIAGVRTLPLVMFLVAAIVVNGFVVSATGRYMPWFLTGGILGLIGSALLYIVDLETSDAKIYGYSILIGTGAGCFLQLPFSVVQSLVPVEEISNAIGFITFAQLGAPGIMLAVANAVFLNEASANIASTIPSLPSGTVISILSGVGSSTFEGLSIGDQRTILDFIVQGLSKGYIITITSGGLAVILSLFLSRGKMFK